jgi:glycosyltransferase involved in cell wall biosynthesis
MHDSPIEIESSAPKISIGLVVYNGIEHIRGALDSMRLSYRNIELIVVDGDSKDGTLEVLNEYAKHISVLVSKPDKGVYDAMNKVCSLATGDWLIFLGCDDVLLDGFGNIAAKMTDPDTVYHGDAIFRSNGNIYGGMFSKHRLARQNFCHQAMFYPKSVYKKYFYSMDYKWLADYAYNIKLVGIGIPFVYIGVIVSIYNDKGGSSQGDAEFEKRKIGLIRSSFGLKYALLEILRRLKERSVDKTIITIGAMLKSLLPYSYWKYLQSFWRRVRNKHYRRPD